MKQPIVNKSALYLFICFFMAWINMGYTLAQFAGGDGSENNPYQIKTALQLKTVGKYLNKHFVLKDNIDLKSISDWSPIGSQDYPFKGIFNGNGYAIYNLKCAGNQHLYYGLFGLNVGTIKNLGLIDSKVICIGLRVVGGIAGVNKGSIENCYFAGTTSGGGIVGTNAGIITNCYNAGICSGNEYVGGIAAVNNKLITNCYNIGNISGEKYVGGISGYNDGDTSWGNSTGFIKSCYNIGNISGGECIGGIVGENNLGTIKTNYNAGKISGKIFIGGIAGSIYGLVSMSSNYYLKGSALNGIGENSDLDMAAVLDATAFVKNVNETKELDKYGEETGKLAFSEINGWKTIAKINEGQKNNIQMELPSFEVGKPVIAPFVLYKLNVKIIWENPEDVIKEDYNHLQTFIKANEEYYLEGTSISPLMTLDRVIEINNSDNPLFDKEIYVFNGWIEDSVFIMPEHHIFKEASFKKVIPDIQVSNQQVTDNEFKVRLFKRTLYITSPSVTKVQICDFNGRMIRSFEAPVGESQCNNLGVGIYIVKTKFGTVKVRVK